MIRVRTRRSWPSCWSIPVGAVSSGGPVGEQRFRVGEARPEVDNLSVGLADCFVGGGDRQFRVVDRDVRGVEVAGVFAPVEWPVVPVDQRLCSADVGIAAVEFPDRVGAFALDLFDLMRDRLHTVHRGGERCFDSVLLLEQVAELMAVEKPRPIEPLVGEFGAAGVGWIELDRVHRFEHDWERAANLQLRDGNPDVADTYNDHHRLLGGTSVQMERAAVNRWAELRANGKSVLLMSPTNDTVGRLNQRAQQHLIRTGRLDPAGRHATARTYKLYAGDQIATRCNDRGLITDRSEMVRNRATWTINTIHADGAVTASGKQGTIELPAAYVAEHVELAYATTGMGAQGRTVQSPITVLDGPTDVRNLYVPMTRGRESNEAFITTTGEQTAVDVFAQCLALDWIDQPVTGREVRRALSRTFLRAPNFSVTNP